MATRLQRKLAEAIVRDAMILAPLQFFPKSGTIRHIMVDEIRDGYYIITRHPVFTEEELHHATATPVDDKNCGVDSLLYWFQLARSNKDFPEADRIKGIGNRKHFTLAYTGTAYEVHMDLRQRQAYQEELESKKN